MIADKQCAAIAVTWRLSWRHAHPWLVVLWLGIGIPSAIVFGGNGMSPHDLTLAMQSSWLLRAALWSSFFLLALPAARAAFAAPELIYLRTLPVSYAEVALGQLGVLAVVELPWVVLHALGGGFLSGVGAFAAMLAAHAVATLALRYSPLVIAAAVVSPWAAIVALACLPFLLPGLWRAVPAFAFKERRMHEQVTVPGILWRALWRTKPELFARALFTWVLCGLAVEIVSAPRRIPSPAVGATGALWWVCLGVSPVIAALEEMMAKEAWVLGGKAGHELRFAMVSLICGAGTCMLLPLGPFVAVGVGTVLWLSHIDLERRAPRDTAQRIVRNLLVLGVGTVLIWR